VRRGISPVIATVILIAVTLAIGIAVAAWLMGIWGGLGGGEQLRIFPESTLEIVSNNSAKLELVVKNEGSRDVVIRSVTVAGYPCTGSNVAKAVVGVGGEKNLTCTVNAELAAGASYEVKVYTEGGSVFTITLVARQAPQGQGGT